MDVVFRDVDEATLRKLLDVLGAVPFDIEGHTAQWTTDLAVQILRLATRRASTIARALVDHDGEITVDEAHAVASLNASWRKVSRSDRRPPGGRAVPTRPPVESRKDRDVDSPSGRLSGYRMDPGAVGAFRAALDTLGRRPARERNRRADRTPVCRHASRGSLGMCLVGYVDWVGDEQGRGVMGVDVRRR